MSFAFHVNLLLIFCIFNVHIFVIVYLQLLPAAFCEMDMLGHLDIEILS